MDELTRRRLEHNEAMFRSVNEEIDERGGSRTLDYVCECADTACSETVPLSHEEYVEVRRDRSHFLVVPGHERPEIERVVAGYGHYLIVEKS